jgi:hypothetical protein
MAPHKDPSPANAGEELLPFSLTRRPVVPN